MEHFSDAASRRLTRRRALAGLSGTLLMGLAGCTDTTEVPDDAVEDLPAPVLGNQETASVTVQVFEDFACPHCKNFNANIAPTIISNYVEEGHATYEWHDYPIPVSDWSWPAAMSARAVQDRAESSTTFWQYKQVLFDNQKSLSHELFREGGNELDLDGASIVEDTKDNRYRPVVQADRDQGEQAGVSGTPTVLVEGQIVRPDENQSFTQAISAAIESHLE